jgi:hypothetical protein
VTTTQMDAKHKTANTDLLLEKNKIGSDSMDVGISPQSDERHKMDNPERDRARLADKDKVDSERIQHRGQPIKDADSGKRHGDKLSHQQ